MKSLAREGRTPKPGIFEIVLLTFCYTTSGVISLCLAVPPGYASPIFPPAGIALAATLLWGNRALPGIWLGSVLLNTWVAWRSNHSIPSAIPLENSILLSIIIGSGAALQAYLGSALVKRFAPYPSSLLKLNQIIKFLFLGGFTANLVNSTGAVVAMVGLGIISQNNAGFIWWNWWVGDTIGVLVFTPLLFTFFAQPQAIWKARRVTVSLPLLISVLINLILFLYIARLEKRAIKLEQERLVGELVSDIQKNFVGYLDSLYALEGVISSRKSEDPEAFRESARHWLSRYPGIYDAAWIPRVSFAERENFEQKTRQREFPSYQIREIEPNGDLKPAGPRKEYFPVRMVEPFREGLTPLGFDVGSSPERKAAMDLARDLGKPSASRPVQLMDKIRSNRTAILVFLPLYEAEHDSVKNRRKNLKGFVLAVIRMSDVIEASLRDPSRDYFELSLYDDPSQLRRPLFVQNPPPNNQAEGDLREGLSGALPNNGKNYFANEILPPLVKPLRLANRQFWIEIKTTDLYLTENRNLGPWLILGSGLILCAILTTFLLGNSGHNFVVEKELHERKRISEQLARSNTDLEQFANVVSHDLKAPLVTVSRYAQLLKRKYKDHIDAEANAYIKFMVEGVARMYSLIDDLLEYSRLGREESLFEETDANLLLKNALTNLGFGDRDYPRIICLPLPKIWAIPTQITQVFQNLIGNAAKYRGKNDPVVQIEAECHNSNWIFSIKDNGIGIEPVYFERIFSLFQRLHNDEKYQGNGIGLALCKRIINRHGGRIWVESTPGIGSIFRFAIPISPRDYLGDNLSDSMA